MCKRIVLSLIIVLSVALQTFGAIVFNENMGTPTGTTTIALNAFQNSGTLTYAGNGDVRNTTSSSGLYAGASGGGNVFLTNTAVSNLTISNINTSAFVAGSLTLTFGAFKSTVLSDLTELQVAYSTGGAFTNLNFAAQPTGNGTATWRSVAITDANLIPISSSLQLRWTNTSTTPQFRIDDISLQGNLAAVPEPSSIVLVSMVGGAGILALRRRKSKNA